MGQFWRCSLLLQLTAFLLGGGSGARPQTVVKPEGAPTSSPTVPEDLSGHSLRFLCTVIWEPEQGEPDFVAVAYLNDQPGGRYNSTTKKVISQGPWGKEVQKKEPRILDWYTKSTVISEQRMKNYLRSQTHLHNQSRGLYIWQRLISCETSKDGRKRGFNQHAYNGEDYLSFDMETLTWTAATVPAQVTKRTWDAKLDDIQAVRAFLEEECIWWLQKFLFYGKESLLRREPPTVTVGRKEDYDGLETLTCRVHGFHPKEIDVTWRKDGKVWNQETFHGGVIPNWDGTYHTWLSVKIHTRNRDRYRCHVEHDSLPEPIDLAWKKPAVSMMWLFWLILVVVAALLVLWILFYCLRRQRAYQACHRVLPSE